MLYMSWGMRSDQYKKRPYVLLSNTPLIPISVSLFVPKIIVHQLNLLKAMEKACTADMIEGTKSREYFPSSALPNCNKYWLLNQPKSHNHTPLRMSDNKKEYFLGLIRQASLCVEKDEVRHNTSIDCLLKASRVFMGLHAAWSRKCIDAEVCKLLRVSSVLYSCVQF